VLTDNRVWVDQDGRERVAAYRSDSMGLNVVRRSLPIEFLVLSTETDPVVTARCNKMKIPAIQGVSEKASVLQELLQQKNLAADEVLYIGNDVNDLGCFEIAGYAVAPADAEEEVKRRADLVLTRKGGLGAVRELCDLLLQAFGA